MPSSPDSYVEKATQCLEAAQSAAEPGQKAAQLDLARAYLRLAELARKNQTTDLVYETPSPGGHRRSRPKG